MLYCLDTNTCIDAMKGLFPALASRFSRQVPGDIFVPSMVRAELMHGALRSASPVKTRKTVERFLSPYAIRPFDGEAADHYAAIRMHLEKKGRIIGPNDLVIAATARSRNLILITHNTKEFRRVPGLHIEDWTQG